MRLSAALPILCAMTPAGPAIAMDENGTGVAESVGRVLRLTEGAMTDRAAQTKVEGRYWGGNTSLTVAVAAVWHIADHYGQLVPYLRLNNIVPPPTKQYPLPVR